MFFTPNKAVRAEKTGTYTKHVSSTLNYNSIIVLDFKLIICATETRRNLISLS